MSQYFSPRFFLMIWINWWDRISSHSTHPDGEQRGGVEGCEQHGVSKHQDEAGSQGDLQGGMRRGHVM